MGRILDELFVQAGPGAARKGLRDERERVAGERNQFIRGMGGESTRMDCMGHHPFDWRRWLMSGALDTETVSSWGDHCWRGSAVQRALLLRPKRVFCRHGNPVELFLWLWFWWKGP